jgi:pimeloyl-ACP methyl ester carboxylesterase
MSVSASVRDVVVDGVPISVTRRGDGDSDVLFVHGVYVNGNVWDDVVDQLSLTHTCWVPTLPLGGHARPVGSSWHPTLEDLAALVPGLIDALELQQVTVVGNDTGGGLVLLSLALQRDAVDRIRSIILTNCDSFDHLPPKAFRPIVLLARRLPRAVRILLRGMLVTDFGRRRFLDSVSSTGRTLASSRRAEMFGPADVLEDAVRVTAALAPTTEQLAMAWLPRVTVPVRLVWGEADTFFPRSDAQRLAAALPDAAITWVPGAKAYVQLDAPEAVAAAVRDATREMGNP